MAGPVLKNSTNLPVMKNKKPYPLVFSTVLFFILFAASSSCHKPGDDSPGSSAQFSAVINGEDFKPTIAGAFAQLGEFSIIGLMPKSKDTFQLMLSFKDTVTVHSKLTFNDYEAKLIYINIKGSPTYSSWAWYAHGAVSFTTVDKTNKKLAGKFNGVIYLHGAPADSLVITNGQFNTTYQ